MKTIRHNCYETNSSSTHSITICRKGSNSPTRVVKELVIDNVLYPGNLSESVACIEVPDGHALRARTKDEKAALCVHYAISFVESEFWKKEDIQQSLLDFFEAELKLKCGYDRIVMPNGYTYYHLSEYGDKVFTDSSEEGFKSEVYKVINDIILDDTIEITDTDYPN